MDREMQKHVVLTLGRSDSNTLCNMLNQSPEVLNVGDVLGSWAPVRKKIGLLFPSDEKMLDDVCSSRLFRIGANAGHNRRKRPDRVKPMSSSIFSHIADLLSAAHRGKTP